MSLSGIFVAPKSGRYFFSFSGISDGNIFARVELQLKTETVDWSKVGALKQTYSLQSTLELAKGNQIRLMLLEGAIHDGKNRIYTHFVGQLLEEEILH
jgi:hypothetical protein